MYSILVAPRDAASLSAPPSRSDCLTSGQHLHGSVNIASAGVRGSWRRGDAGGAAHFGLQTLAPSHGIYPDARLFRNCATLLARFFFSTISNNSFDHASKAARFSVSYRWRL